MPDSHFSGTEFFSFQNFLRETLAFILSISSLAAEAVPVTTHSRGVSTKCAKKMNITNKSSSVQQDVVRNQHAAVDVERSHYEVV